MNKEVISDKQGISLIALFILGSSSIAVSGFDANIFAFYIFPFQVILPIIIWITAEIKKKQITSKI